VRHVISTKGRDLPRRPKTQRDVSNSLRIAAVDSYASRHFIGLSPKAAWPQRAQLRPNGMRP